MALSRKTKIFIGIGILSLLAIAVVAGLLATRSDAPEVTVVKVTVKKELNSTVTAPGEIRPIQFINLTSEVQGRIEEIFVQEGEAVEKGTQLVRLDPDQLQSSTDAQVAALEAARDDMQSSRSQVTAAQNQLSQAQQGLIAQDAAITTAQQGVVTASQQVSTAQESVNQARQQAVAAQTDVDRTKVELNAANRELKRTEELLESGVASRLEYDQAKDRVANAQVALRNAEALLSSRNSAIKEAQNRVKEAQTRVKEAIARVNEAKARSNQQSVAVKDARRGVDTATYGANASQSRANQQAAVLRGQTSQRDKTLQLAPIAGVIADIPSKVGQFATANLSSTPLLTIADMSTVNVEVKVDETEIDKVSLDQSAKVKVDAFGEQELNGRVSQKTPLAVGKSQTTGGLSTTINVQEAKEFKVVIELTDVPDNIREGLRPGMSATAVITTDSKKDVIAVPIQAVIEKKPEDDKNSNANTGNNPPKDKKDEKPIKGVFILEGNKVKFVEVTTGITGESEIEITSGLKADQKVITGPSKELNKLKDGDTVKEQVKKAGDNENKS